MRIRACAMVAGGGEGGALLQLEERRDGADARVEVGTWVKVSSRSERGSERFWCRVASVRADGGLVARVDNDLRHSAHRCGDEVTLRACHVLETADAADMSTYRRMAAWLGPMDAGLAWQQLRSEGRSRSGIWDERVEHRGSE